MQNIRGVARQKELRDEMENLLLSSTTKVQVAALNILVAMGIYFIKPYKVILMVDFLEFVLSNHVSDKIIMAYTEMLF